MFKIKWKSPIFFHFFLLISYFSGAQKPDNCEGPPKKVLPLYTKNYAFVYSSSEKNTTNVDYSSEWFDYADFDGNGTPDQISQTKIGNNLKIVTNNGNELDPNQFSKVLFVGAAPFGDIRTRKFVDLNGDGYDDFFRIVVSNGKQFCYFSLSNGRDFYKTGFTEVPNDFSFGNLSSTWWRNNSWWVKDKSGCYVLYFLVGTRLNRLSLSRGTENTVYFLNAGSGFPDTGWEYYRCWGDVDGNGTSDFCFLVGQNYLRVYKTNEDGRVNMSYFDSPQLGSGETSNSYNYNRGLWYYNRWIADQNGDGFGDYIRITGNVSRKYLSITYGPDFKETTDISTETLIYEGNLNQWVDIDGNGAMDFIHHDYYDLSNVYIWTSFGKQIYKSYYKLTSFNKYPGHISIPGYHTSMKRDYSNKLWICGLNGSNSQGTVSIVLPILNNSNRFPRDVSSSNFQKVGSWDVKWDMFPLNSLYQITDDEKLGQWVCNRNDNFLTGKFLSGNQNSFLFSFNPTNGKSMIQQFDISTDQKYSLNPRHQNNGGFLSSWTPMRNTDIHITADFDNNGQDEILSIQPGNSEPYTNKVMIHGYGSSFQQGVLLYSSSGVIASGGWKFSSKDLIRVGNFDNSDNSKEILVISEDRNYCALLKINGWNNLRLLQTNGGNGKFFQTDIPLSCITSELFTPVKSFRSDAIGSDVALIECNDQLNFVSYNSTTKNWSKNSTLYHLFGMNNSLTIPLNKLVKVISFNWRGKDGFLSSTSDGFVYFVYKRAQNDGLDIINTNPFNPFENGLADPIGLMQYPMTTDAQNDEFGILGIIQNLTGEVQTARFFVSGQLSNTLSSVAKSSATFIESEAPDKMVMNELQIRCMPNPVDKDHDLLVEMNQDGKYKLQLVDLNGKVIRLEVFNSRSLNLNLDMIETGVYLMQVEDDNGKKINQRIIIK